MVAQGSWVPDVFDRPPGLDATVCRVCTGQQADAAAEPAVFTLAVGLPFLELEHFADAGQSTEREAAVAAEAVRWVPLGRG